MGQTITVSRRSRTDVDIEITFRPLGGVNANGDRPEVRRVDLIVGRVMDLILSFPLTLMLIALTPVVVQRLEAINIFGLQLAGNQSRILYLILALSLFGCATAQRESAPETGTAAALSWSPGRCWPSGWRSTAIPRWRSRRWPSSLSSTSRRRRPPRR